MASHLLAAGHSVAACDLVPQLVQAAVARGASAAPSPSAAAREAEVVFSSIPDDRALRAAALSEAGVLAGARPGTVYVDDAAISLTRLGSAGFQ